jgi:hypothetical protein
VTRLLHPSSTLFVLFVALQAAKALGNYYLLEGEEAGCQRQEDVQFLGIVQRKHALDEEVGVFEPTRGETLVAITTASWRAKSLTEETLESLHDVVNGQGPLYPRRLYARLAVRRALGIAERHGWTRFVICRPCQPALCEEERANQPLCAAEDRRHPMGPQARRRLTEMGSHQRPAGAFGRAMGKPNMPTGQSSIASRRSRRRGGSLARR